MNRTRVLALLIVLMPLFTTGWAQADHPRIPPEEIHRFERQNVTVSDFQADGLILAIGGGGEGVIGQLKGSQVVAIDILKRELEDAPGNPLLKIVMDARDLKFLDGCFRTVTSFYTLMYIDEADHARVYREAFRVLAPGGRFLIWEAVMGGVPPTPGIRYGVIPLHVILPDRDFNTGYGVHWPPTLHDAEYYTRLAKKCGFRVVGRQQKGVCFMLELVKPVSAP